MIIFFFLCFALPFSVVMVSYSRLLWTLRQVSNKEAAHTLYFCWLYWKYNGVLCAWMFFLGNQAAGIWNRKHKSCRGAGGAHGSSDGAGLPSHLAAICCACSCCHDRLQSICRPCHRYHSCVLCKKQHCLQPHHIHFHEQTGKLVWSTLKFTYKQRKRGIQAHAVRSWPTMIVCLCVCFQFRGYTVAAVLCGWNPWSSEPQTSENETTDASFIKTPKKIVPKKSLE